MERVVRCPLCGKPMELYSVSEGSEVYEEHYCPDHCRFGLPTRYEFCPPDGTLILAVPARA